MLKKTVSYWVHRHYSAADMVRVSIGTLVTIFLGYNYYLHRALFPDQMFICFLMISLGFLDKKIFVLFVKDWLPFFLFIFGYAAMRSFIPSLYQDVHIIELVNWEKACFGWLAGGEIPAIKMKYWLGNYHDHILKHAADIFFSFFYIIHFVAPMIFMAIIWFFARDRRFFYRFVYTYSVLNFMGLATYVIYPAAPPWYYDVYGTMQPSTNFFGKMAAGGLINLDYLFRMNLFSTIWGTFNRNHFAAVPSLHAAWAFVIALYVTRFYGKKSGWIWLYPLMVAVAGVYFNQHYIIDYFWGWAYVGIAYGLVEKILLPRVFDKVVRYELLKAKSKPMNFSPRLEPARIRKAG